MSGIKWPHRPHPRHISAIVEEQAQRFAIHEHRGQLVTMEDWPVVTISYEYGIPGRLFGRRLAERLDFDSWDRKRVALMARSIYRRMATVPTARLWNGSTVDDFMSSYSSRYGSVSEENTVHCHGVLDYICRRGRSVIVGNGGRRLVDSYPALQMRLVAPIGQRVHWVAMRNRIDIRAAQKRLMLGDKKQAAIEHAAVNGNKDDLTYYDLVINMATFAHERAVGLVLMAYLAKFGKLPVAARSHSEPLLTPIVYLQPPIDYTMSVHPD